MPVRLGIPLLVVVAAVFLTIGWTVGNQLNQSDPADAASEAVEEPQEPVETTTTAEPAVTTTTLDPDRPTPENPLRVVLAGDSVMAGLAPPLGAALESEESAEVRFVLTPSVLRDATVRFTWQKELEDFNPDVIVMFVGTWELGQVALGRGQDIGPESAGWRDAYDDEVLDPWIEFITSNGADVVWIGTPAVDNVQVNLSFAALNQAFADAADRWDEVTYLDGGRILGQPQDGYDGGQMMLLGRALRTRQIDGLHLCPDGAALLAADLLDVIEERYDVPLADEWDDGAWRDDTAYPPQNCPRATIG